MKCFTCHKENRFKDVFWKYLKANFRFKGRISRGTFLMLLLVTTVLFVLYLFICYSLIGALTAHSGSCPFYLSECNKFSYELYEQYGLAIRTGVGLIGVLWFYVVVWIAFIRRGHDLNQSGWVYFIPIYGNWISLLCFFKSGAASANIYGENPKLPKIHTACSCPEKQHPVAYDTIILNQLIFRIWKFFHR